EDINYTLELWHALEPLCRKWTHTFKDYNEEYDNIFQESYSILTEAVENYQLDSPVYFERYFKTYLYNWRATYLHKKQREVLAKDEKEEESFKNQIENKENTEEQALLNVHLEALKKILGDLPQKDYQIIWGFYMEHKSIKTLSLELGLSCDAIESQKRRTIKKIKKFSTVFRL
ncbi:MAG: sigma-70 family RNA polymerase sigma factor, partial [Niameybacter sp.]